MAKPKKMAAYTHAPYPQEDDFECGCKVSWNYYHDKAKAEECAKAAEQNREWSLAHGYDFGFCWPGTIEKVDNPESKRHGMYRVCLP